ncbi:MAG: Bax inhibitor-1/YccA family protein [Anaerolineae bacterium]|nr:Bax inhibitor-1/YccA family protein [Phycisphaerae bacterium]
MSNFPGPFGARGVQGIDYEAQVDSSVLVRFFNQVYAWMASGLALTAVVAWYISTRQDLTSRLTPGVVIFLFLIELGLVIAISSAINKISAPVATLLFMLYAAINGIVLSAIFLVYAHASIVSTFVVTAGMFAVMSIYGMVTRTDLTRLGAILFMALIGLIIASVVNMFMGSSMMQWIISIAGVVIFAGLTAYDTQKLKAIAMATQNNAAMASRLAISGALALYLDFLNLFLMMLRLMGDRR